MKHFFKLKNYQLICVIVQLLVLPMSYAADNLKIIGTLVEESCVILPENSNIEVDYGPLSIKSLYQGDKMTSTFKIILSECATQTIQTVSISFKGNITDSGLLALDSGSQASGIEIGLTSESGQKMNINSDVSPLFTITNGENELAFESFVQGQASAIANKTIKEGAFTATATFLVTYN